MAKIMLFMRLYVFALRQYIRSCLQQEPKGIRGSKVFLFKDVTAVNGTQTQGRAHGVVAFALPPGVSTDSFSLDLWGPFGYSSQIDLSGNHLYGRDTWGCANSDQIHNNRALRQVAIQHPGCTIVLAGVRKIGRWHPWPLNNANKFILVYKREDSE